MRQVGEEEPLPNFRVKLESGSNDYRIKAKSVHCRKKMKGRQKMVSSKDRLDFILKNKGEFIRQYFKEINEQVSG